MANGIALQASTLIAPTAGSVVFDQSVTSNVFALAGLGGSGNLALQNNAATPAPITLVVGGNNGNSTFSGRFTGPGSLIKVGAGTLDLTGANVNAGQTTISSGTLQIGDGTAGHDGSLSSASGITNNAALVFDLFGAETYAGVISSSGNLTKNGGGALTLGNANTFSGQTVISGGTLDLANALALQNSIVVTPSAGRLVFDQLVTSGSFTLGGLSGSANLALQNNASTPGPITLAVGNNNASATYSGVLTGPGGLTKIGAGTLILTGTNSYAGQTNITSGLLQLGDGNSGDDGSIAGNITDNAILVYNLASSQTYSGVIGGAGSVVEAGSGTLVLTRANTFSGGMILTGGTLQLGDGTNGHDGSLTGSGGVTDNAALVYDLYGTQTYSGVITGFGSLTKLGGGTLMLQGANTFSGPATINSGILNLSNSNALQASTVAPNGGSVAFDQSVTGDAFTFGGLTGSGNLSLQNNAAIPAPIALTVGDNNSSTTYSGALSGPGSLTKVGTGTLVLSGSNGYTGATTVSGGMLEVTSKKALAAASTLAVNPGGTFTLSVGGTGWTVADVGNFLAVNSGDFARGSALGFDTTNANFSYSGSAITGNMGLTKLGANTLTLTGASTFAGPTLVSGGTLQLGDGINGHDGSLSSAGGAITDNATLAYDLYGSQTYSGVISGSGNLVKAGNGTLILVGSDTVSGPATIAGGTLQLGDGTSGHDGSLGSSSINNSGALVYDIAGSQTYSGAISGTGSITKRQRLNDVFEP